MLGGSVTGGNQDGANTIPTISDATPTRKRTAGIRAAQVWNGEDSFRGIAPFSPISTTSSASDVGPALMPASRLSGRLRLLEFTRSNSLSIPVDSWLHLVPFLSASIGVHSRPVDSREAPKRLPGTRSR